MCLIRPLILRGKISLRSGGIIETQRWRRLKLMIRLLSWTLTLQGAILSIAGPLILMGIFRGIRKGARWFRNKDKLWYFRTQWNAWPRLRWLEKRCKRWNSLQNPLCKSESQKGTMPRTKTYTVANTSQRRKKSNNQNQSSHWWTRHFNRT